VVALEEKASTSAFPDDYAALGLEQVSPSLRVCADNEGFEASCPDTP
jgi:hypothetical protein